MTPLRLLTSTLEKAVLPVTVNCTYDLNGNITSDGLKGFEYDDANQLTRITQTNAWKSEFSYDGLGRRRITKDYTWTGSAWSKTNEVRYVYDGIAVLQERDGAGAVQVTYTRGLDLSGSIQGAGGIGGLLARTEHSATSSLLASSSYYHSDAGGNITAMTDSSGNVVAKYLYDPFGNLLAKSGAMADLNRYRFSSKEVHLNSGSYYYGYRFYEPNLQRWLNEDPIRERGGMNLFGFVGNNRINFIDPLGLTWAESAGMTWDWITGRGPKHRDFGPDSNQVKDMMNASQVNEAREYFYNKNKGKPCKDWEGVSNYKGKFGVKELCKAGLDPTEQFVGSYRIDISYNANDGTATYTLNNTTSFKSLTYGVGPDWNGGPGGNVTQTYTWTEKVP